MNVTNCPHGNESVEEYLQRLQNKTNLTLIPAVVMMGTFAVTGLIGNILVLIVYSKKFTLSPTKVLIMTIASFDLVANVGAIPSEATVLFDSWNFSRPALCKSKVFLLAFSTLGGGMSLLVVAIVRYRKVCRPHAWQVTIRQTIIASVAVAAIAFIVSIPYVIIYGIKSKETPCLDVKGSECYADNHYFYTIWPLMNNILFILLYVSFSTSLVWLYVLIGVTAWKHSKHRRLLLKGTNFKSNIQPKNTGSADGIEGTRSQSQSLSSDLNTRDSKTDLQQLVTKFLNNGSLKKLLCCRRQTSCNSVCSSQRHMGLNSMTPTTDNDTTENSRETSSEKRSQDVASSEDISFEATISGETNHTMTESSGTTIIIEDLQGNNPEKKMDTTNNDELSFNMNVIPNISAYKPADQISDSILDTLDQPDTTRHTDIRENSLEPSVDGTCTQNTTTLTPSNSGKENIVEKRQKSGKVIGKRASKSNSFCNNRKTSNLNKPLGRMAAILIIISAIYVLGYIPFLVTSVIKNRRPDVITNLNMAELSVYHLFHRLYFVNSAANPIIYSLCNINFRRACMRLFTFTSNRRL
ncbi:hypothetical protein BsWGS_14060 [Bradybaena similaris]